MRASCILAAMLGICSTCTWGRTEASLALTHPLSSQWHGYGGPLWKILNPDTKGQGNGPAKCGGGKIRRHSAKINTDGQPLGYIVKGYGKYQQRASLARCFDPLAFVESQAGMKVWQGFVRRSHEYPAAHKADDRRQLCDMSQLLGHLYAGCEK